MSLKQLPSQIVSEWWQSISILFAPPKYQKSTKIVPGINWCNWFLTGQFQWLLVSYTSSMRIRNKKLSRRFVARIPFAKWRQILALYTRLLDYWAIYKADKNSSWRQQGLKLRQESNSFFKITFTGMFWGHTISQYAYDLRN